MLNRKPRVEGGHCPPGREKKMVLCKRTKISVQPATEKQGIYEEGQDLDLGDITLAINGRVLQLHLSRHQCAVIRHHHPQGSPSRCAVLVYHSECRLEKYKVARIVERTQTDRPFGQNGAQRCRAR